MLVEPYLFFDGRCEEAIEFYKKALGAEVTALMRFKESPDQSMMQPGAGEKVLHAAFRIGDTTIFASDGPTRESRTSRASRSPSQSPMRQKRIGGSKRSPKEGVWKCLWRRPSSVRASEWSPTASA